MTTRPTRLVCTAIASLAVAMSYLGSAMADDLSQAAARELAPSGTLRVAINFGNTVLAQKDPATGEPRGVSGDLARELAKRLGVPIAFATYETAGKVFDGVQQGAWDIC